MSASRCASQRLDPLGGERRFEAPGASQGVRLGGECNPDLVPTREGNLQRRCSADAAVEGDRDEQFGVEERCDLVHFASVAREVEVDRLATDDRTVHGPLEEG